MRLRVGLDLDGCLYDFGNSVRRYLDSVGREYGFKDGADEPHHWDFYEYWGMDREEFTQICHDGVDAGFIFSGPARPHAAGTAHSIKGMGHEIIIITDRQFGSTPRASHEATANWLAKHNIEYDELWFSADKTIAHTDMFVEDKISNYDALDAAGVEVYLINRPWNLEKDNRRRIDDIADYGDIVLSHTIQHRFA